MKTRLRIHDYYLLEGLSSMANALLLFCLYFYVKDRFGYSDTENLLLGAAQGLTYIFAAKYGGRLAERTGYESVILAGYAGLALLALTGALPPWRWWPFILALCYTACIAPTWPALEAAITHCPSRISLPARLGIYNIMWSLTSAAGFFLGGALFEWRRDSILWVPGLIHVFQVLWILLARRRPAAATEAHPPQHREYADAVPAATKQVFLHTAWIANGASYFLATSFMAVVPHLGERLGLPPSLTIWLTCSLFFSRSFGFLVFWRWEGWHYRMAWSQSALWLAPAAAAVVFFASSYAVVLVALLLWGLAQALTYYTSLYYSMDVGEKKGEHGGLHESILGMGVLAGPLAGATGSTVFGSTTGALLTIVTAAALISASTLVIARRARCRRQAG